MIPPEILVRPAQDQWQLLSICVEDARSLPNAVKISFALWPSKEGQNQLSHANPLGWPQADRFHTGRMGSFHTGGGIFDHQAF